MDTIKAPVEIGEVAEIFGTPFEVFTPEPVQGIWDETDDAVFARYGVELRFTDWLMGGVPQDKTVIEGWLRSKAGITDDQEVQMAVARTLMETGKLGDTGAGLGDVVAAVNTVAVEKKGQTFYRDAVGGLFVPARYIKAMLKENTNILFAGERWGKTKKGPKNFLAERIHVEEYRLYLGRDEPDGTYQHIGHVSGAGGDRSIVSFVDYCEQPTIKFTIKSLEDLISLDQYRRIFLSAQENGLGAMRSLGFGKFKVTRFERV